MSSFYQFRFARASGPARRNDHFDRPGTDSASFSQSEQVRVSARFDRFAESTSKAQMSKSVKDTEAGSSRYSLALAWTIWVTQIPHHRPCGISARSAESIRSVESMVHEILSGLALETEMTELRMRTASGCPSLFVNDEMSEGCVPISERIRSRRGAWLEFRRILRNVLSFNA